jgi:uncharacterized protein YndB with AHSA1/START domain
MTGTFERFDARPGGSYRLVLTYADASASPGKATAATDIVESRFIDLVPGARVVQAVDFVSDDPAYAGTMTMTWEVSRSRRRNTRRHHCRQRPGWNRREGSRGRAGLLAHEPRGVPRGIVEDLKSARVVLRLPVVQ